MRPGANHGEVPMKNCSTRHEAEERVVELYDDIADLMQGRYDFAPVEQIRATVNACRYEIAEHERRFGFSTVLQDGFYMFTLV